MSITDHETNNISLIGVLEEIVIAAPNRLEQTPQVLMPPMFDIVTLWGRQDPVIPELGYARVCLLSPSNEILCEMPAEIDLRQNRRVRMVAKIIGLAFRQSGVFHCRIERRADEQSAWEEVARLPLEVSIDPGLQPLLGGAIN